MKKQLATVLAISVLSLTLTSCKGFGGGKSGNNPFDDDTNTSNPTATGTTTEYKLPYGKPSRDLSTVEVLETFDDVYIDDFDKPWGA